MITKKEYFKSNKYDVLIAFLSVLSAFGGFSAWEIVALEGWTLHSTCAVLTSLIPPISIVVTLVSGTRAYRKYIRTFGDK